MNSRRRRFCSVIVMIALCAGAAGGCSFDRRWRQLSHDDFAKRNALATTAESVAPIDPLAGRWDGKWTSEQDGHSGRLRAIVDRVDDTTYHIEYDGWFFGLLRFTHGMDVTATRADDGKTAHFEGHEDLGALAGGVYRYAGTADGRQFTSTYQSSADHGRFEMHRPEE
jgi:hypothetical protein